MECCLHHRVHIQTLLWARRMVDGDVSVLKSSRCTNSLTPVHLMDWISLLRWVFKSWNALIHFWQHISHACSPTVGHIWWPQGYTNCYLLWLQWHGWEQNDRLGDTTQDEDNEKNLDGDFQLNHNFLTPSPFPQYPSVKIFTGFTSGFVVCFFYFFIFNFI